MPITPDRVPVILAVGQSIERDTIVSSRDLMERAARAALDEAPAVLDKLERVTVVDVLNDSFEHPASAIARRLGATGVECQSTTVGGNTPQWLVNRTAAEIARGELSAALLVGAEALNSVKKGTVSDDPDADLDPNATDTTIGVDQFGVGPSEIGIKLFAPIYIYPMFEAAMAAEADRTFAEQRTFVSQFMARNTAVAAKHPFAWFPDEATVEELAAVTDDNRLIAEPYTKRLNAIMAVDQGAAVIVTSLQVAQDLGLSDQAIHIWAGADVSDVWFPVERPELHRSPGIAAAGSAVFEAAGVGVDDIGHLDLYSCFPAAVQAGAAALGIALDDPRGLTVTGGLAYFGGPGNNYTMHSIATMAERLRMGGGLGLCTGLGWYTTKHSIGIYGADPAPEGFRFADTTEVQARIDASARPTTLDAAGPATVVASTITYERDGTPSGAPVFADLPDGTRVAAEAAEGVAAGLDRRSLVGTTIDLVGTEPLTYEVTG
jgi:acetyl-CoA C-acetyltransferase